MSKVYWLCLHCPRMMKSSQLFSEPKHFKIVKCWNQNQWAIPKERKWKMKKVIPRWSAVLTIGAFIPCRYILITTISIIIHHTFAASRRWSLCEELKYIYTLHHHLPRHHLPSPILGKRNVGGSLVCFWQQLEKSCKGGRERFRGWASSTSVTIIILFIDNRYCSHQPHHESWPSQSYSTLSCPARTAQYSEGAGKERVGYETCPCVASTPLPAGTSTSTALWWQQRQRAVVTLHEEKCTIMTSRAAWHEREFV